MTFAHGEFRVFLEAYAKVRGVTVVHPSEAFTTKTCTGCGFVREVGGVHTLHCERCRLTIDRDLSGPCRSGVSRHLVWRSHEDDTTGPRSGPLELGAPLRRAFGYSCFRDCQIRFGIFGIIIDLEIHQC
jgi:hypothetical protein